MPFRIVTTTPMPTSSTLSLGPFAYLPITAGEFVSQICVKIVMGSCSDSSAWLHTRPWKGSVTKKITMTAPTKAAMTPSELWRSWMS